MTLLLDSHVFVWALFSPGSIGPKAREELASAERVMVSMASLWELALKHAKGKFPYPPLRLVDGMTALGVEELGIEHRHLHALSGIDLPHGDPFDTLLTAQAQADGLALLTADQQLLGSSYQTFDARH